MITKPLKRQKAGRFPGPALARGKKGAYALEAETFLAGSFSLMRADLPERWRK